MPPEPRVIPQPWTVEPEQPGHAASELQAPPGMASAMGQSAELNAAAPMAKMAAAGPIASPTAAGPTAEELAQREVAKARLTAKTNTICHAIGQWNSELSFTEQMVMAILEADQAAASAAASQGISLAQASINALFDSIPGLFGGFGALLFPTGLPVVGGQILASALSGAFTRALGSNGGVSGLSGRPALLAFVHRSLQPAQAAVLGLQAFVGEEIGPTLGLVTDLEEATATLDATRQALEAHKPTFLSAVQGALLDAYATCKAMKATDSLLRAAHREGAEAAGHSLDEFSPAIAGHEQPEGTVEVVVSLGGPGSKPQVRGITTPGATPDFKAAYGNRPLRAVNAPVRVRGELDVGQPLDFDSIVQMAQDGTRPTFVAARTPAPGSAGAVDAVTGKSPIQLGAATPTAPRWLARHGAGDATLQQANPALTQQGLKTIYDDLGEVVLP